MADQYPMNPAGMGTNMPGMPMPQGPNGQPNQGMVPQGMPMPGQPGSPPQMPLPQAAPTPPSIDKLLEQVNIAEELDKEELKKIGASVYDGYMRDLRSKDAWDKQVDTWVKLAAQIKEEKSYPWPKASNIKYPLLARS